MKKWMVDYDGPFRPIIIGPHQQMFSISKFINGKWQSFAEEEKACQLFCDYLNLIDQNLILKDLNYAPNKMESN